MVTPGECQLSCRKVQKMTTMVEDVNDLQKFWDHGMGGQITFWSCHSVWGWTMLAMHCISENWSHKNWFLCLINKNQVWAHIDKIISSEPM